MKYLNERNEDWKEYWSGEGEHFLLQGDLLNPGIEPVSPVLQAHSLPTEPPRKPWWGVWGRRDTCTFMI